MAISPTYAAALSCIARGWSVIPLVGGAELAHGKTPAVAWSRYRRAMPSQANLYCWFVDQQFSAYGVVCGKLSKLIVIDFDDAAVAAEFASAFPDLADTYTVRSGSRGTPHLYFRVEFPLSCQKIRGGDLKGEGGYVVGAESVIGGRTWMVTRNERICTLSRTQLDQVLAFLKPPHDTNLRHEISDLPFDAAAVVEQYQREVTRTGERNNSLFKLALKLRDQGVPQVWTQQTLAEVHAHQRCESERVERRLVEAQKTIVSAYSRPCRAEQQFGQPENTHQMDNGIREALLQHPDGTAILRTYEGLLLRGIAPGETFTRKEAFTLLAGLVGEFSIKKALSFGIDGEQLFALNPSPAPPSPADADPDGSVENKAKRCFVTQQKPSKNAKGRPARRFVMPAPEQLRLLLGITANVSDSIREADLTGARTYRQALQRELIKQRPGQYSQAWLANRLGVTARSIYSYHRAESIASVACFKTTQLDWENHERLLPPPNIAARLGFSTRGRHLETAWGKRYPATVGLAKRLLTRGAVFLKERTISAYEWRDPDAIAEEIRIKPAQEVFEEHLRQGDQRVQAVFAARAVVEDSAPPVEEVEQEPADAWWMPKAKSLPDQAYSWENLAPPKPEVRTRKPYYSDALEGEDDERIAQKVYEVIKTCSGQAALSLSSARCLVDLYGAEVVNSTLGRMLAMHHKGKISNPAGFMVAASRVRWRKAHQLDFFDPAPRFKGERR